MTFETAAKEALFAKGNPNPTTAELQREMIVLHLQEAASLAGLLDEPNLAKNIERLIKKIE